MTLTEIYNTVIEFIHDGWETKAFDFIRTNLKKERNNLDLSYLQMEYLIYSRKERQFDNDLPAVIDLYKTVIAKRENYLPIEAAKAYCYLGLLNDHQQGRQQYFDLATHILNTLKSDNSDVNLLNRLVHYNYHLSSRKNVIIK